MVAAFKWSITDWHELVDSGVLAQHRVELLEGKIIQISPEEPMHSSTNYSVVEYFREILRSNAVVREAHPITLDNSEPEPDIAVVRSPHTNYFTRHPYPQDVYWLVEVRPRADVRRKGTRTFEISNRTLKLDLEKKAAIYARNGVAEYWIIDLINKKLIVHIQPTNNGYARIETMETGTIFPQAFPNLAIALNRMLLF